MTLGKKISKQRKIAGLSQESLAEKCGITLRTVQRIENDKSIPRPYTLRLIADFLNLNMEDLEADVNLEETNAFPESTTNRGSLAKINLINSSALLGILFPFLNLIAPVVFWKLNNNDSLIEEKGRKIINFQILWTFSSISTLLISFLFFKATGVFIYRGISTEFLAYLLLLIVNVFFIIRNSIQLNRGDTNIYTHFPNLL